MNEAELLIYVGRSEDESDALRLELRGSPNQALGFIARARFELDKLENKVKSDLTKEPTDA